MLSRKGEGSSAAPSAHKRGGSSLVPEAAKRARESDAQTPNVRIWWPPTASKSRTSFSGMYWPARVVRTMAETCEVLYDNGEKEVVEAENVFPVPPVPFGEEATRFLVSLRECPCVLTSHFPVSRTARHTCLIRLTLPAQIVWTDRSKPVTLLLALLSHRDCGTLGSIKKLKSELLPRRQESMWKSQTIVSRTPEPGLLWSQK